MATEVIMPKAGMAMEEGTVVKWLKKEGDRVEVGETIVEITTDKVNMEIEAEVSGVLMKILASEGDVLPILTPIAYIGEVGETINVLKEERKDVQIRPSANIEQDKAEIVGSSYGIDLKKVRATPAARKFAKDHGIDLSFIQGKGPKGRIQKADVSSYNQHKGKATPLAKKIAKAEGIDLSSIKGSGHKGKIVKRDIVDTTTADQQEVTAPLQQELKASQNQGKGTVIPLSSMRKIVGKRMSESFFTAPTFTLNIEVDMSQIKEMRSALKDIIMEETGCKLTYTDIIIMACGKTLKKHPIINSSLIDEGILLHDHVSIALAVGLDEGLLVPVIRNVDKMTLGEIVSASKDLASRAEKMKLQPKEQENSTFTISNLGMYGISHFNPIINQPNSAILGVSAIVDRHVVVNGEAAIRPMMNISMTVDHRVIDGTPGAKFLYDLKVLLENPMRLLV